MSNFELPIHISITPSSVDALAVSMGGIALAGTVAQKAEIIFHGSNTLSSKLHWIAPMGLASMTYSGFRSASRLFDYALTGTPTNWGEDVVNVASCALAIGGIVVAKNPEVQFSLRAASLALDVAQLIDIGLQANAGSCSWWDVTFRAGLTLLMNVECRQKIDLQTVTAGIGKIFDPSEFEMPKKPLEFIDRLFMVSRGRGEDELDVKIDTVVNSAEQNTVIDAIGYLQSYAGKIDSSRLERLIRCFLAIDDPKIIEKAKQFLTVVYDEGDGNICEKVLQMLMHHPWLLPHQHMTVLKEIQRHVDTTIKPERLVQALSEAESFDTAEAVTAMVLGRRLADTPDDPAIDIVFEKCDVKELELADGGCVASPLPFLVVGNMRNPSTAEFYAPFRIPPRVMQISKMDFLAGYGVRQYTPINRADCYPMSNGRWLVIKHFDPNNQKTRMDAIREVQVLAAIRNHRGALRSEYPVPIVDHEGVPLVFSFEDGRQAIIFEVDPIYYSYLGKRLPWDHFREGGLKSVHDIFVMARDYRWLQTVPMNLFHNTGRSEMSSFCVMPSLLNTDHALNVLMSTGDIENLPDALNFPNMGQGGARDMEGIRTARELLATDAFRWIREFDNAEALVEFVTLANTPISAALLAGDHLVCRAKADDFWKNDQYLKPYIDYIEDVYKTAYRVRKRLSEDAPVDVFDRRGIRWNLVARQLAFYISRIHAGYVYPGVTPEIFPTKEVYGEGVKIRGKFGRLAMGPYRHGTYSRRYGFTDPDGNNNFGPYNGPFPATELLKATWALFL